METSQKENINFSVYMHFAFRVLGLGSLISIIPLVFINLPLRVAFLGFPTFFLCVNYARSECCNLCCLFCICLQAHFILGC